MPNAIEHTAEEKADIARGRRLEAEAGERLAEAVAVFVRQYHDARSLWEQARDTLQAHRITPPDFAPHWRVAVQREEWVGRRRGG